MADTSNLENFLSDIATAIRSQTGSTEVIAPADFDTEIERIGSMLLDLFHPVGSYYETSDGDFDPNTAWGGTWNCYDSYGYVTVGSLDNNTVMTSIPENDYLALDIRRNNWRNRTYINNK